MWHWLIDLLECDKKEKIIESEEWLYETRFSKPKRNVHTVFLHCSASDNPLHDNIKTIRNWHLKRGFAGIGYHYYISKDGEIHKGRDLERTPAAQKGHNTGSIAICLGGLYDFTDKQFNSLKKLCFEINGSYAKIRFRGHREVANKLCPVYDYKQILNLDEKGYIYE